ncbi:MAG TPA: NAD(P)/FAD-dependent oxidoreductase, partial [Atribacterota bacterium]|nr:NAD(P)/FAD-dependent oxidoreductase [Atribacterota bacterium]
FILKTLSIDFDLTIGLISEGEINSILKNITNFYLPINGTQSWKYAQVTCGGISVKEVNPETMESRIVPHLYFAGEILDVDGDCGGYNLQWAWSSGYLAGKAAAQNI